MYRRYRERRYRRHRNSNYNDPTRRLRSTLRRPSTQIGILLIVALIIYLILQSANQKKSQPNSLPPVDIGVSQVYTNYQNGTFFEDVYTPKERDILLNLRFTQVASMRAGWSGKPAASYTPNFTTLEEA